MGFNVTDHEKYIDTRTQGELHTKMKAEIKGVHLYTKDCQRLLANHQKLEEKHGTYSPSLPSEGTNPADTLILGLYPPEL